MNLFAENILNILFEIRRDSAHFEMKSEDVKYTRRGTSAPTAVSPSVTSSAPRATSTRPYLSKFMTRRRGWGGGHLRVGWSFRTRTDVTSIHTRTTFPHVEQLSRSSAGTATAFERGARRSHTFLALPRQFKK